MAPPRRGPGDAMGGGGKRDSSNGPSQRKDGPSGTFRQNGSRPGFRTDTTISNNRPIQERQLQAWIPEGPLETDGALESNTSQSNGKWDQFAANERLFGLKTDYNENYYTTAIDRSHPQYKERAALAERAARDIEGSAPATNHVAEERIMDFISGGTNDQGGDEEDKYSGVRRQTTQDFPPLVPSQQHNKYTPPARRAPTGQSTVTGAPVDPAIISAQIKGGPPRKAQSPAEADKSKVQAQIPIRSAAVAVPQLPLAKTPELKSSADKPADAKQADKPEEAAASTSNSTTPLPDTAKTPAQPPRGTASKPVTPNIPSTATLRAAVTPGRASLSPAPKSSATSASVANSPAGPSATEGVENALLKDFRDFASQQRLHAEKARASKIKADAQSKLQELRKFATSFKLSTPVPSDLISIIAKDPAKQKQIQEKAIQNAEEIAKAKTDVSKAKPSGSSPAPAKAAGSATPAAPTGSAAAPNATPAPSTAAATEAQTPVAPTGPSAGTPSGPAATPSSGPAADNTKPSPMAGGRPQGPMHNAHNGPNSGMNNRHNMRGGYNMQQNFRQQQQPYRNDRSGPQHIPQGHSTGNLAERIRNNDQGQNRYNKNVNNHGHNHFNSPGDGRAPPTGPANQTFDNGYSRRMSNISGTGSTSGHLPQKLNPTTHEFRPSAAAFNPSATGPSGSSSPRSTLNPAGADTTATAGTSATASVTGAIPSPRSNQGLLIRRKTQNVTGEKCNILAFLKTKKVEKPAGAARNKDSNGGLVNSYDTSAVWRQPTNEDKPDSSINISYTEYFERQAAMQSMPTPLQGHAMTHMPPMGPQHHPMHMQHNNHMHRGPHNMPPMQMHGGAPNHMPQASFNGAEMMASNSAQSYASPRPPHAPMYPQHGGTTPQMAYNQPGMPYMHNGPQMNQFRSYSNNPQGFMPQNMPMMPMMPQHFNGGMMPGQHQMMYPGGPQFMGPPGAGNGPPPSMAGSNGYPSPRPVAAPMMGQQNSQQGQPMHSRRLQ